MLTVIFVMIAISSISMAVLYSPGFDPLRIFYGTDTRAAVLAMVWFPWQQERTAGGRIVELLGWSGLITLAILYNQLNEFQLFLYRGGILITAVASALFIVGASSPTTWISKLLEARSLRWIGSRSYSIYLWHWPMFMLTRPGFDIQLPELFVRVGQLAVTFGLAEISYRWIESPVRQHGFRVSARFLQEAFKRWSVSQKLGVGAGIVSA